MIDQRGVQIGPIGTLRFGQDVAEHDERLDSYFLRTGTYWALVHDEVDLIIGAKGTGKSAIARYLSRADADIEQLNDVIIMPAFNIRGSILFKRLINQVDADDEGIYREIFLAYMVGLAGNYLIKTFQDTADVVALEEGIRGCGLIVDEPSPHSVWRRVLSRIRPRLGTTITIVDVNEPSDASVAQPASGPLLVSLDTLEGLLDLIHEALEQLDLRLWILFDRLDEAFPDRRDIEVAALRGLLRAHLDVCSFGARLRPKLFLRLDIFDRITQKEGFVNATHLRTTRIAWDSDAILHMIALRVTASGDRRELFGPTIKDMLTTSAGRRRLCRSIFPKRMENLDPLVWLLLVTVDATREFNPRNVLTLLRSAQLAEIQIAMRDRTGLSGRKDTFVLSSRALQQGYKQLSTARMQDTLYAESTIARTYIEKLRGRAVRFTESEISERLGVRGEELEEILRVLRYIGFLRNNEGVFIVPPLYRPAFFMSIHGAELRLGAAEASEISDFAEQEDAVGVDDAVAPLSGVETGKKPEAADGDEEQEDHAETPGATAAFKRKRRRTRPKRRESSRDELVPTNTPSEINDQLDFAQELGDALGNDDGELVEVATKVGSALHAASSTSPGVGASGVPPRDSTTTLPARTGAWAVGQARELGDQGDAIGGFHLLYPQHTGHDGAACVAADLAYLSGDRATINLAIAMLKGGQVTRSWPALGRLLVFELMVSDIDAVNSLVSSASKRYGQEIAIAVVRMVGQVPELEAAFWQTSLAVVSPANAPNSMLKSIWPILAASRVMAIGRNSWERGAGNVANDLNTLRNQIWTPELWKSTVRNIQGFLHAYAAGGPTATLPVLVPYQILSLASVLENAGRLSAALRAGVARSLGTHLDGTDVRHRERFLEWVQYSPLVLEVEMTSKTGVQAGPAERRSGARDAARRQPDGTGTRDQSRNAEVLNHELCDFVVRVIQDGLFEGQPGMLLSQLGTRLLARSPGFNYRALGYTSLLDFVKAVSDADNRIVIEKTNHNHPYVVLS
ncbi:P-loop ATPase, Sll1717 family [Micromonospora zamorensis]|uniref:P-loop ATPase, Sll1717 family n=1 Tax=Micromonospora zamorensis TaxID=709883 RepID=UPI0033A26D1D